MNRINFGNPRLALAVMLGSGCEAEMGIDEDDPVDAEWRIAPYRVAVAIDGASACIGSLVAPEWVLVPRDCTLQADDNWVPWSAYELRAGTTGSLVRNVVELQAAPADLDLDPSIALLRLDEALDASDPDVSIRPPRPAARDVLHTNDSGVLSVAADWVTQVLESQFVGIVDFVIDYGGQAMGNVTYVSIPEPIPRVGFGLEVGTVGGTGNADLEVHPYFLSSEIICAPDADDGDEHCHFPRFVSGQWEIDVVLWSAVLGVNVLASYRLPANALREEVTGEVVSGDLIIHGPYFVAPGTPFYLHRTIGGTRHDYLLRTGAPPTRTQYDCSDSTPNHYCEIDVPTGEAVYVGVHNRFRNRDVSYGFTLVSIPPDD